MIELVQEPDSAGESFFFRINGVDIFCGGSCWIPADSLPPRVSPEKYRSWLELMIEGRQNMTRYVTSPGPSRILCGMTYILDCQGMGRRHI